VLVVSLSFVAGDVGWLSTLTTCKKKSGRSKNSEAATELLQLQMTTQPTPLPARISLTPDEIATAQSRVQEALSLGGVFAAHPQITSPVENQATVDFLRDRLDPAIDFCNSLFTDVLAAIDQLKDTTKQSQMRLVGPLLDLKTRLRAALQQWDDHLREVQRQIDAERALDVARRSREILEQDTLNKANELIEAGDEEAATTLLESFFNDGGSISFDSTSLTDQTRSPLAKRVSGSRADGQSSSTLRRARVIDINKLKPEYVIKSPNTRAIQAAVTKHGKVAEQVVSVNGEGGAIEYYEKGSVSVRKRKPADNSGGSLLDEISENDIDYVEGREP
jgi:hypothetical protein